MIHTCQNIRYRLALARQTIRDYLETLRKCSGCGRSVSLLADFCPTCGTSGPVILPVSPATLFTVVVSLALVILLSWT